MVNVWFAKVKQDAVIPTKREEDAGYDIFLCFEEDFTAPDSPAGGPAG